MIESVTSYAGDPFAAYRIPAEDGVFTYAAGFPSYPANFSRDTFYAGILSGNADLLYSQLCISAIHQGMVEDNTTGEQPGKIHHEFPGAQLKNRPGLTTYNACDTTALFLIAVEALQHIDPSRQDFFIEEHNKHIHDAAGFLINQTSAEDGLFWERPVHGANKYSLRVTYWKDSILPHMDGLKTEPTYPVSYALAHIIAARGILSAARILENNDLANRADEMFCTGIDEFFGADDFTVYCDAEGSLQQVSSDELHSLAYIPVEYASRMPLDALQSRARHILTPYGYMCTPLDVATSLPDRYHGDAVWVFEQAVIHYGAIKFGMREVADNAQKIVPFIANGQELFGYVDGTFIPLGNDRQLWSVAAAQYFKDESLLAHTQWL